MDKPFKSQSTELISHLKQLAQLSLSEFDIEISYEKMLLEQEYLDLVLSELNELNHEVITKEIIWINQYIKAEQVDEELPEATSKPKKTMMYVVISCAFITLTTLIYSLILSTPDKSAAVEKPVAASINKAHKSKPVQPKAIQSVTVNKAITLPVNSVKHTFKIHGSNTIGEKLAPALLVDYLKSLGVSQYKWVQGNSAVERSLQYILDNEVYSVQLHAHGSSTAFKGLKGEIADLGMASRKIKSTEALDLKAKLGSLTQVGNEHIIGLDGLAVIVNQNNPIKHLSTEKLARVFSGEINNWSQLGGQDKAINLFARDQHSGTWDTFKNLVLKKFKRQLAKTATRLESSSQLSTLISQDENAIGFIGLNYVLHNKALAISEGAGTKAIFPTRFTIGTEDYALARRLYFYTPTKADKIVKDFAQFAISQAGQDIVERTGLISQNIKIENVYPIVGAPAQYNQYAKTAKRLSLNFRFNYGNKDLDNKGKRDLQRLVSFMEQHNGRRLVLMGFSDSIGAKIKNAKLSLTRATSVERELAARGIPVVATEGLGEALPVANNETEAGRERNRRVEVWLL